MSSAKQDYVIGIDFGTSSVRAILVDAHSGKEETASEFFYPRWKEGRFCDASKNQFRQHPLDYVEGLEYILKEMLEGVHPEIKKNIRSVSVDTTGSTPVAVDKNGIPLALHDRFKENPNAMFFLWKDHSAIKEAEEINLHAEKYEENYLKNAGGIYSSEWFWAKLLYVLRKDSEIEEACHSWVEHCDWIPFLLTGGNDLSKMKRSVCAAGHKALWAEEFGGFPPLSFFSELDQRLKKVRDSLPEKTYTSIEVAGRLSEEWAKKLGLSTEVLVGVGALDAHMGAVGGQIEPYYMSKVMGTSTCDMIVAPEAELKGTLVQGICGQVSGSIIPGMIGMEAGQSAFGDIYAWFRDIISWPLEKFLPQSEILNTELTNKLIKEVKAKTLLELNEEILEMPLEVDGELAVDWLNGRRTPDANQNLNGAIHGLTLGSTTPGIYRSLVEATCFGSRKIIERFIEEGIPVKGLIGVGGVAKKSPVINQMMADITGMPIKIHKSEQTCALGASMFAATIAGVYQTVSDAMEKMGPGFEKEFYPDAEKHKIYNIRYKKYKDLCNYIDERK